MKELDKQEASAGGCSARDSLPAERERRDFLLRDNERRLGGDGP